MSEESLGCADTAWSDAGPYMWHWLVGLGPFSDEVWPNTSRW